MTGILVTLILAATGAAHGHVDHFDCIPVNALVSTCNDGFTFRF